MAKRPSKVFITYNGGRPHRTVHREECPTCSGSRVPVVRRLPAPRSGKPTTSVEKKLPEVESKARAFTTWADVESIAQTHANLESSSKAESAKIEKAPEPWLTPARATIIAAVITALAAILVVYLTALLREPTPTPAPAPAPVVVNQQQFNQNR